MSKTFAVYSNLWLRPECQIGWVGPADAMSAFSQNKLAHMVDNKHKLPFKKEISSFSVFDNEKIIL